MPSRINTNRFTLLRETAACTPMVSTCLLFLLFGSAFGSGWYSYIDGLFETDECVKHAAIIDKEGEVWVKDKGLQLSDSEITRLVTFFTKPKVLDASSGETFSAKGTKYEVLQAGGGTLLGLHDDEAFFAAATRELVICVIYERSGEKNAKIRLATIQLARYLLSSEGY